MKPVSFDEQTCILAESQPEYLDLPVYRNESETISCWRLNLFERIHVLLTGRLWLRIMTGRHLLQPQLPTLEYPFRRSAFERLLGAWRLWFGFCPACNSDAPEKDTCLICLGWTRPQPEVKRCWRARFLYGDPSGGGKHV